MAEKGPVQEQLSYLTYEQQWESLPDLPARPVMYAEDFPAGELASMAQAKFQMQRSEQERDARLALSGHLAQPWAPLGPLSPQEEQAYLEECEEYREQRCGLPDSPTDMPSQYRDAGGRPFTGLRG